AERRGRARRARRWRRARSRRGAVERRRRDRGRRACDRPGRRARAGAASGRLRRRRGAARGAGRRLPAGRLVGRFRGATAAAGLGFVAEIKRRSPSAGDLRPNAEPAALAAEFAAAGAAAVSVLVDERFAGSVDDLVAARAATPVPLLGKGFFSDERQLEELRRAGADAVLLLLRDLDDGQVRSLMDAAARLGLDALVEAHDEDELERAARLGSDPIGLNARDLGTFRIDRRAQLDLVAGAPRDRVVVAESGVTTRAQAAAAELAGANAVLVGSALVRAAEPAAKLVQLASRPLVKVCGLTRQDDVDAAIEADADLCGFVLAEGSPRRATAVLNVPEEVLSVAVFVGDAEPTGADLVQLYERRD